MVAVNFGHLPDFNERDPDLYRKLNDLVRALRFPSSPRNPINAIVEKSAAYGVEGNVRGVIADGTGGAFAVSLPFAADRYGDQDFGQDTWIFVKRINGGGNAITVSAQAGDTIDGAASKSLNSQYAAIAVVPDGSTRWHIVGLVGTVA